MSWRLLALDLDGTILDGRLRLDPRDVEAVRAAVAAGVRVVACTGRPFPAALPWVRALGLRDAFVCYQGAQVRGVLGEVVLDHGVPKELAAEVVKECRSRRLEIHLYRDDRLLAEQDRPEVHVYADHAGMAVNLVPDLVEAMGAVTPKLVSVGEEKLVERLLFEFGERWRGRLLVSTSLPNYLEMTSVEADKRSALEFLAGRLGIASEEAIAIGDGRNDVSILSWAGLAAAVEGSPPELLQVADRTIPAPGSGGIAALLAEVLPETGGGSRQA